VVARASGPVDWVGDEAAQAGAQWFKQNDGPNGNAGRVDEFRAGRG
jgi:hypothetical protein